MTNRLSNCLRKELKKGGFTIERVCLYRALNTPLTDLANAETFWEDKLNSLSPTTGIRKFLIVKLLVYIYFRSK